MTGSQLREVALLVNPASGRGRGAALAAPVADALREAGLRVRPVSGADAVEALDLAAKAVADGVDALVAVGGDGTANLAVQALAGTDVPLGLVPAGTGNDVAAALGLPTDPSAAAQVVARGRCRAVDAVLADTADGPRWWAGVLAAGFDAAVNERANRMSWPRGRRRYDLAILAELRVFRPVDFVLELDGRRVETEGVLVAVGNTPSYGAGMRITPDAQLDDGLLDVTVVGPLPRRELVRMFPTVYRGTHVRHPAVTRYRAASVRLSATGQLAYADGERLGALPLTNIVRPGALNVLVP